jgi:osmoprotectant transport system substrate-binding protein
VAKLDDPTMIELNARIDVDGEEPVAVAQNWLTEQGFLAD